MASEAGLPTLILLTALISLSLACMNVLPIPVLDGGRWLMLFVSRKIFRKTLSKEQEEKIISYGVFAMLGLTVVVFILDILRIF
jgi:regulator of sigma E protease